jgi:mono/diheme cytochrome c family protein
MALGASYLHLHAQGNRAPGAVPVLSAQASGVQTPPATPASAAAAPMAPRAVLDKYCVACHSERLKTAGLVLEKLDTEQVAENAEVLEKVVRKMRAQEMPPPGRPRPDQATYKSVVARLSAALDSVAVAKPNPGRVAVHRLNRAEYTNAILDLLGMEVDGKALLAAEDPSQEAFDNMASVLSVSPALLDGYLSASRTVSRRAVGDETISPAVNTYRLPNMLMQDDRTSDALPFGSRGGTSIRNYFPLDGEYSVKVVLKRELYDYIIGMGEQHLIEIRLDGARVARFAVGGEGKGMTTPESYAGNTQGDPEWEVYMHTADANLETRFPVKAGTHEVGVSFVRQLWEPEGINQPQLRGFGRSTNEQYFGNPAVDVVSIAGPYSVAPTEDSAVRRKVFVCQPTSAASEEPCAKQILSTVARRAYRRPLTDGEVQTLLTFYKEGRAKGTFDNGIQFGLRRILASPSFLFRIEREPAGAAPGTLYRLTDLELASRLSFFLWSSIPDDELLDLASRNRLSQPAVLDQQIRRMLRDPKSQALIDNFATQWLTLGKVLGVAPDVNAFPDFDENLRESMMEETRQFVASQMREDRNVVELLTANYSYLNERMAKHYGIPNIYGNRFRRVTFTDGSRGGLLGQASILALTSYPTRTSIVLRGKWLLASMLGTPPPPPPPDVPDLPDAVAGHPRSLRARMEMHRASPVCASCHSRIDPLGFSLENFDALGKYREEADGETVDASATLLDGTQFKGLEGLRNLLAGRREEFVETFTEKLLSYAVGRGVEYYDLPAVRKVVKAASAQNYRWSSVIAGIAKSTPFTMGIVPSAAPDQQRVAANTPVQK